ncbi:MAG: hypothetical protein ABIA37_04705 [Candidatus Woesearchaeota archaeon]
MSHHETDGKFDRYWNGTEIIRGRQEPLSVFEGANLPYIFVAEPQAREKAILVRGFLYVSQPTIVIPGTGAQFMGLDYSDEIPGIHGFLLRTATPNCNVTNRRQYEQTLEYGCVSDVLKRCEQELEAEQDAKTALIKGYVNGLDVSLMRYFVELSNKSAPSSIAALLREAERKLGPIRPDERISAAQIHELFNPDT